MKTGYTKSDFTKFFMLFAFSSVLISCGTYRSAANDDGIYDDDTRVKGEKRIVVVNKRAYKEYDANYFAEELDLIDEINNEDIFVDVDDYNSIESVAVNNDTEEDLEYTPNQPWGSGENNDVVININVNQNPYWMGDVWAFDAFRFNYWSFNRGRFNNWGWGNNYFYGNRFYGYGWSNYDPYGYNRYAYSYYGNSYGRNGRYYGAQNQRRGRYAYSGRRATNVGGRWLLNNTRRTAYNSFTRKRRIAVRSSRNTNAVRTIRNTRNTTSNIKPKPTRNTRNNRSTRNNRRTQNTRNTRDSRSIRNTRNSTPNRTSTRSSRSSSRSSGNSASRNSSRRKN